MSIVIESPEPDNMQGLPPGQDLVHDGDGRTRQQWLDQATFCLYQARKAECPEAYPLPFDQAPRSVRADLRYLVMTAYRRLLPLVPETLAEIVAMNLANLDGFIYPDCDNKPEPGVAEHDQPARAAQRRQDFRRKSREILHMIFSYLEHDCDTDAQRQIVVDQAKAQRERDVQTVSSWRSRRGTGDVNGNR
jgi:hypothetical protein